jgi:hypothetical protein
VDNHPETGLAAPTEIEHKIPDPPLSNRSRRAPGSALAHMLLEAMGDSSKRQIETSI